ncbi:serine--tRNA ligase [Candidatus Gracilibacteria bacterium]|nr:serine--tRNA ligase [Candidatus Gracilibacteria bacterium]MCF7898938.1 serine--tRNA ligase [Candidatus Paceibacterota bacterium]
MLDIKFIRENSDLIKASAVKKNLSFNVEELIVADTKRLETLKVIEDLRAQQNVASDSITKASAMERADLIESMRSVKDDLKKKEEEMDEIMKNWRALMLAVPNIPDMSVPEGKDDADNQEVKKWGSIPAFTFKPLDHIELMEGSDMVDFERGTKTSGFRGYFLKNDGAILEMAVWQYVMQRWHKKGFTPMLVPSLVKRETLLGSGYLPQGEDDLYKDGNDYLAGTGEVATMFYHSDEVLDEKELPKKYIVWSPCFRKEAGSHGKDVKGLVRVHEFYKCEQVILCEASHETSVKYHEEIRLHAEEMMEELGIPYHTVVNCGGDLGLGQVKKYDIEAWMPSQEKYRETHSASYFHDFQTRRLNIRYKDGEGKMRYVHSLNNTAAATPRLVTAIIENYQQADGTIKVPDVLVPFMGGVSTIGKAFLK